MPSSNDRTARTHQTIFSRRRALSVGTLLLLVGALSVTSGEAHADVGLGVRWIPGYGDFNGDGMVDAEDVESMGHYLTGNPNAPQPACPAMWHLDLNQSGEVTVADFWLLAHRVLVLGEAPTPYRMIDLGDVNGDDRLSLSDVFALISILQGEMPPNPAAADIDGDQRVDIADLQRLLDALGF